MPNNRYETYTNEELEDMIAKLDSHDHSVDAYAYAGKEYVNLKMSDYNKYEPKEKDLEFEREWNE